LSEPAAENDKSPKHVLVISGLDPSGGAGFIADIRVVEMHCLRPVGVVTAHTEQDTRGLRSVEVVDVDGLANQLRTLLSDIAVDAVKIGMLGSEAIAKVVAEQLCLTVAPVVWDPILAPTSGSSPLLSGSIEEIAASLRPHLTVVTPNLEEASKWIDRPINSIDEMTRAAQEMRAFCDASVLLKGGHLSGPPWDVLATGGECQILKGDRIEVSSEIHGTGCALSTALACFLARGEDLNTSVRAAISFVRGRIAAPVCPGRGSQAVV